MTALLAALLTLGSALAMAPPPSAVAWLDAQGRTGPLVLQALTLLADAPSQATGASN